MEISQPLEPKNNHLGDGIVWDFRHTWFVTKPKIPAAHRTLALLRAMAEIGQPTTAARLAQKLSIPRSSTYQLLEVLEQQGFAIHFEEEARWGLGVSAWELGSAYLRHEPLERLARPVIKQLLQKSGVSPAVGHLGVLQGSDVLYLIEERPAKSLSLVSDVGVRLPAHLTASGRAMLASLEPNQVEALYARSKSLVLRTSQGPASFTELKSILRTEREQGFALEVGEVSEGYSSIGVAVLNHLDYPLAGIAITFQTKTVSELQLIEIAKKLRQSAIELSRKLGHHG